MGQDFRLTRAYEQMLKGNQTPQSSSPKSLMEAYGKVLAEQTVFYAKSGNDPFVKIGIVSDQEEASRVKNKIKSYSIKDMTNKWLTESGWSVVNPIATSRQIGQMLYECEIDLDDINEIVEKKSELNTLEASVLGEDVSTFELFNVLYEGITKLPNYTLKTEKEKFVKLFEMLTLRVGEVNQKNVGPGEMLMSLFSNSTKPEDKGDLQFGSTIVEVKGSGSALGYAHYAVANIKGVFTDLLKSSKGLPDLALSKIKSKLILRTRKLKDAKSLDQEIIFTDKFVKVLEDITAEISRMDLSKVEELMKNKLFIELSRQTTNSLVKTLAKQYEQNGLIFTDAVTTDSTAEISEHIKDLIRLLKDIYKEVFQILQERPSLTLANWNTLGLNEMVAEFFLSDLNLTSDQLTTALLACRPYEEHAQGLQTEILETFERTKYKDIPKTHDIKTLRGLYFALQVSEYAREEGFSHLLLFNKITGKALPIQANKTFKDLLSFYEQHQSKFTFYIGFGGRQGAHRLILD